MGQHSTDAKLDLIGKQMEDNLKEVRENVGQLREYMDKLGEERKQGLDSFREDTNRKFETVDVDMWAQKKDIEMLEKRTADVEEWSTEIQEILKTSLDQQSKLREKVSNFEGRSRRNNIRMRGLKEGVEGDLVTEYVYKLIHKELELAPKPQPNKPPRAIIVNFLRFDVKENVLRTAWRMPVEVEGRRVTFDHD
ncbi:hypothetical protein F2P81_013142 [Scophthalmus maximus]|uniref:Uncharacterized protein n=1 Tax=Scophthalmus maximus TaxID=52904 RepID=A0A6A4SWE0_SCOMX|nr:hypothetical protein F2P81_013142 [Scophthalmus maximus]